MYFGTLKTRRSRERLMVETVPFQPDVTGTVNSPARPLAGLAWPQERTQSVTRKAPTLTARAVVEGGSLEEFAGQ